MLEAAQLVTEQVSTSVSTLGVREGRLRGESYSDLLFWVVRFVIASPAVKPLLYPTHSYQHGCWACEHPLWLQGWILLHFLCHDWMLWGDIMIRCLQGGRFPIWVVDLLAA
jgi:hypothetical protein